MREKLKLLFFENLIFILIAFSIYVTTPAILNAQNNGQPQLFIEPVNLTRGKINPQSYGAEVWPKDYYCEVVTKEWGWTNCDGLDAFIVGYNDSIDTLLLISPDTNGFVEFDDWNSTDTKKQISAIEKELISSMKTQSENSGQIIKFEGWRAYPKLDKINSVLYYATDISFDGEIITNIKATVFDRYGYNEFRIVPRNNALTELGIGKLVLDAVSSFESNPEASYSSFVSGDKVAAGGALAVLATLVGVKYGKAAATGILAIALLFLKKAGFLLLLPLLWILRLFKRKT